MEPDTERLGVERDMLVKHHPNFALKVQTRECTGQVFSHLPSTFYEITIRLPENYPEEPPRITIDFPQNPVIDYFVDKMFQQNSLTTIAQWNPQKTLADVIQELEDNIRKKKEEPIAKLLKERDTLSKKKPNFGFTEDFKKCRGKIFSNQIRSVAYDVEISISPQFPKEPPEIRVFNPKDPLLAHWVNLNISPSDLPTRAYWRKSSEILSLLEELEGVIHSRENRAKRVLQERDILRKQSPTFGFKSDGTTCKGKIYSLLGLKYYEVTIALPQDFPAHPPNVVVISPNDPLIKEYVNTTFNSGELKSVSSWNLQTHVADIVGELQTLIRSREEDLLKRMVDERVLVRKNWPNFGFTSNMKECNGVVYVPSGERYQVIIGLKDFPQSVPVIRAQGPALANQRLDLPVLRDWNPSITMDAVLKAIGEEIRQIDLRHTSINKELMDLRMFWRSLDFLPGSSQRARGSTTVALPSGDCNVTLDITFPNGYPETHPVISLSATGYKSDEIKKVETSMRRKISSSWSQYKKTSVILKNLPEDLVTCLIGRDGVTGVDFKDEIRGNLPIYYCKKCMNTPSKRICYFHRDSLDKIIQGGGRCIIYMDLTINESDIGELRPLPG